jgi:hypothetical protein
MWRKRTPPSLEPERETIHERAQAGRRTIPTPPTSDVGDHWSVDLVGQGDAITAGELIPRDQSCDLQAQPCAA